MLSNLFSLIVFLSPCFLFAASESTLGTLAVNLTNQLPPFESLVTGGGYILGITFVIGGALKIRQHKESPTQVPISASFMFITMGVLLVYFPTTIQYLASTFFGTYDETTGMSLYTSATLMDGTSVTQQPPT